MNIRKITLNLILLFTVQSNLFAQSSGNAQATSREAAIPVNNFTGIPSISLPLYNYSHQSGIGVSFSLDYFAGGIKVNEKSSMAGLGWNVNPGGMITRTVRSVPDDCPNKGYLYLPPIPTDVRTDAREYNKECSDGEQDIFQFNFGGRSGKFYIGKDSVCNISPQSKMQIELERTIHFIDDENPNDSIYGTISKFTITTEDGVKYIFNNPEYSSTTVLNCVGYNNYSTNILVYADAWNLSYIVAASGKDSIKFNYLNGAKEGFLMANQSVEIENGITTHSDTSANNLFTTHTPVPIRMSASSIIKNIELPDNKKVEFIYGNVGLNNCINRIKVMDSVFRYGYLFNWDTTGIGLYSRTFLKGINYFTVDSKKVGYTFNYNNPYFNTIGYGGFNPLNQKDHWGFYNGANNNRDAVPSVAGLYTGANREPNALAVASTLSSVKDPSGGITYYDFENNDIFPYTSSKQTLNIDVSTNTQNNVTINRVLGNTTYFNIKVDPTLNRSIATSITGAGQMTITLTDLSQTNVFSSNVIDLNELFYSGSVSFSAAIPSGSYFLNAFLSNGTASNSTLPVLINWHNQSLTSGTGNIVGGIRIKQISHYDPFSNKTDTLSTYRYITANGLSSGFLGIKPIYDYTYFNKQIINSNALGDLDYGHGNKVGYQRVEVINGSLAQNLGKQVFEYTNLSDVPTDISPAEFPFMQRIQRDWALGLPKKVSTYDNTNRLIQTTTNTYNYNFSYLNNANNTSIKLSPTTYGYTGEKYFPELGRTELVSTTDTFYHPDLSISTKWKNFVYDTNYNLIKTISPYDKNKNLNIEQSIYYPYNYTVAGIIGIMRNRNIFMPISTETWLTGSSSPKLISLTATDFQKAGEYTKKSNIYKPYITYALETNKPLAESLIGTFDPTQLIRNNNYIKPQQSFKYNKNGTLLVSNNINTDLKNTVIYGNSNAIIAKVSNAAYSDVAYTSFEKNSYGNWNVVGDDFDTSDFFTGQRAFNLSGAGISKENLNPTITYLVTYWTKGSVTFSVVTTPTMIDQRNGWYLYSTKFTGTNSITIYGNGITLIDEIRLHPIDANMESTTFNDFGNVLSTNDANNNIAYFEYDIIHRSKILRDKDKNIIKKFEYSDIITPIDIQPKWAHLDIVEDWSCFDNDLSTSDVSGFVYKIETDTNHLSETYTRERYVYDHIDFTRCPNVPVCDSQNNPLLRIVNNVCELAQKVYLSSSRIRTVVNGNVVYVWRCTYVYQWSDGLYSSAGCQNLLNPTSTNYCINNVHYFTEDHPTNCPINP